MKKSLKNIAYIKSGIFLKPQNEGDLVYLQAKHFKADGELDSELYPDIQWQDISEKHVLKPGDILFSAKGLKNFAAVYESQNLPAVASTSFLIISIWENTVDPEYVALILNSRPSQEYLKGIAKGTSIPSISKKQLEEFEIVIMPREIQQKLVALNKLKKKENDLVSKIERLKKLSFEMDLNTIIQQYE